MRYRGNNFLLQSGQDCFYDPEGDLQEREEKYCPICGSENPEAFYTSLETEECMGCSDCVNVLEWGEY